MINSMVDAVPGIKADHGLRAVKCATCGRPDQPHEHGSKSLGALSANHPRKPLVPERVSFV
jgi:hypothetical protein